MGSKEEKKSVVERKSEKVFYYEEDELDLYEILSVFSKYKYLIFISVVLFLIIGFGYLFLAKPVYRTETVIKIPSDLVSKNESVGLIKNIDNLLNEKRFTEVSDLLGISVDTSEKLKSISGSGLKSDKELIKINIYVYDPSVINLVSKGILRYLNSNNFVKERIDLKKEELIFLLKETNLRLKEIESIRSSIIEKLKNGELSNLGFNPTEIDSVILNLKGRKINLENQIRLLRGHEIAVEPLIPKEPYKPNKNLVILVSIFIGFFVGVTLSFIIHWYKTSKVRRELIT
ncbi:Wzz/FepE/Etk N-terminal domain-containing protein [Persephonella sp.]